MSQDPGSAARWGIAGGHVTRQAARGSLAGERLPAGGYRSPVPARLAWVAALVLMLAGVAPMPAARAATAIDLCAQVGRNAGFSTTNGALVTAVAIAMAESGCQPGATHVNTDRARSVDRGLWQINGYWHPEVPDACAFDAQCNANAAFRISKAGTNWRPWSTFNANRHARYVAQAQAAVARLEGTSASSIIEGMFVSHLGAAYRVAGGAPVYVSTWEPFGGEQPTRVLADAEFAALRTVPADGTVLTAAGRTYTVAAGAPILAAVATVGIAVDPAAIANAGGTGFWAHLLAPPAIIPAAVTRISVAFPRKRAGALSWPAVAGATSYRVRISVRNSARKYRGWHTVATPGATFTGLSRRATYRVQVKAVGASGTGPTVTRSFRQKT